MKITKETVITLLIIALVFSGAVAGSLFYQGKSFTVLSAFAKPVISGQEIYSFFLCPCCGQPLTKPGDCAQAQEMVNYIDALIGSGLSRDDIIAKTAEKYGLTAVAQAKRDVVKALLAKRNPDLFPKENLSFKDAVGKKAPVFKAQDISGATVNLNDYQGKVTVLFFNEGAMCYPACWDQIKSLVKDARFNTDKVVTLSVVGDAQSEWQEIIKKVPELAKAKLLFDTTKAVSSAYDVLSLPSSMHRGSSPGHTFFVIDKDGVVRYTLDDKNMGIDNDTIFKAVQQLL